MLQPEQLRQVEERYPDEVEDLRRFFTSAGLKTGKEHALSQVAARLSSDRAFERDLLSHIWVIVHGSGRQMSYAELLGTVAVAAAGPEFASRAETAAAHDLLRFLMDARQSFERRPGSSLQPLGHLAGKQEPQQPQSPTASGAETLAWTAGRVDDAEPEARPLGRRMALLALSTGFAVTVLVGMLRMHERSGPASPVPPTTAEERILSKTELPDPTPAADAVSDQPHLAGPKLSALPRHEALAKESSSTIRTADRSVVWADPRGALNTSRPQQVNAQIAIAIPTSNGRPSIAPVIRVPQASPTRNVVTPPEVLSQRLGARTLPDYASVDEAKYPTLLRRRPPLPLAADSSGTTDLVASNERPILFRGGRDSSGASAAMVVRPVALGIMAGNVLYSPAPVYPAAAAAARVQGEVKVQAEVDRDGNVASARVISGPPLLRDAAIDAVQRWRYRPYLSAGRPVAMSATAVVDFQLE